MDIPFRNNSNADIYNQAAPVTIQRCIYSGLPRVMRRGFPQGNNVRLNYYYKHPVPPFGPNMMRSEPPVQYQQRPNPYLQTQYNNMFEYPAYMMPQGPMVPTPAPPIDLYNPTNQPYPSCFNLRPEQPPHFQYQAPPFQYQAPPFQHQEPHFQHQAPPLQYQAPPFQHAGHPFKHEAPPVKNEAPMGHYTPHTNPPAESAMDWQGMNASSSFDAQRRRMRLNSTDYEHILGHSDLRPGAQEFVPRQNEATRQMDGQHFLGETEPVQTTGQAPHNQPQNTNAELIKAADEESKQACSSRSVPVLRYTEANNVEQKPKKNGYKQIPDRAQNLNKIVPKTADTSSLNKNVDRNKKVKKRSADNQITKDLLRSGNLGPQTPEPRKKPLILRKAKSKQSTEKEESNDSPRPLYKICGNTKMARIIPNRQKENQKHSTDTNIKLEVSLNDIPKLKPVNNVIIEIYDDNKLTVIEKNPVFDKETLIIIENETNFHNNKSVMDTSTSNQALTNGISDFHLVDPVSSEINPRYDKDKPAIPKTKPNCKSNPFFYNKPSALQNDKSDCDATTISSEPTTSELVVDITTFEEQNASGMNTEVTAAQHNDISNVAATQPNEIYKAPVVSEGIVCNDGLKLLQKALEILENKTTTAREVVGKTGRALDPLLLLDIIAHDPQVQDFITGTPYTNNGTDGGSSYDYYRLTDFQLRHLRHIPNNKFWEDYILNQKMLVEA